MAPKYRTFYNGYNGYNEGGIILTTKHGGKYYDTRDEWIVVLQYIPKQSSTFIQGPVTVCRKESTSGRKHGLKHASSWSYTPYSPSA